MQVAHPLYFGLDKDKCRWNLVGVMFVCANQLLRFQMFSGRMEVLQLIVTPLHILVDNQNVVDWLFMFIYIRTPPSYYYLKSHGRAVYMKTHLRCFVG